MDLAEAAKPTNLGDLVGLDSLVSDVGTWVDDWPQALLFHGPPGTGKTSAAHVIARTLLKDWFNDMNFIESNASDDRGIDFVRVGLKSTMRSKPLGTPRKIILLDEADGLTPQAQDAMRQLIEKYSHNAMVILTCNELEKIRPAIRSRCSTYAFRPVSPNEGADRLRAILISQQLGLATIVPHDEALIPLLARLVKAMNGDLRACIMFLDSIDFHELEERLSRLEAMQGEDIVGYALEDDWWKVRRSLHNALKAGRSLHHVLRSFYENIYEHFDDEENLDAIWDIMAAYGDVNAGRHTWPGDDYSFCDYTVAKMRERTKERR